MIMSPDEALRSYAVKRDAAAATNLPSLPSTSTNLKSKPSLGFLSVPSLVRSASSFLKRSKSITGNADPSEPSLSSHPRSLSPSTSMNPDFRSTPASSTIGQEGFASSSYLVDSPPQRPPHQGNHYTDNDTYNNTTTTTGMTHDLERTRSHSEGGSLHSTSARSASSHQEEYTNPRPSPPLPSGRLNSPAPTPRPRNSSNRVKSPVYIEEEEGVAGLTAANPARDMVSIGSAHGEDRAAKTMTMATMGSVYSDNDDGETVPPMPLRPGFI